MNISFIGFGHMAKAIAQGLLTNKNNQLHAAAPSLPIGITAEGINTHHNNLAVIPGADIIILAVKPAQMAAVFTQIRPALDADCLIISIAAGLSLSWFEKHGSAGLAIVRAMPNMAAAVGKSATPLIANALATPSQKQSAEQIFTSIGLTAWVQQESDMDTLTALSGSGPAYVFLFMEALIKAAQDLGLGEDIARSFTLQTVFGALSLATESKLGLAELRHHVTSPAGTTAAAIEVFTERGLDDIVCSAMQAARNRARQLGEF